MSAVNAKVYLAVDLGASSGRVMAGVWDGGQLALNEVHRFATPSVQVGRYSHWNMLSLYADILHGLRSAVQTYENQVVSIGVDTWGVDYGLLDAQGELLGNPICYRDGRTGGVMETVCQRVGREAIYGETGIQFLPFNTLYQLAAERRDGRCAFEEAQRMLFLPDLLNYWLSGVQAAERSIASTSQMLNPSTGDWSQVLLDAVGVDRSLLGEIVEPGTMLGPLRQSVAALTGASGVEVVAVPGHDTACAFMARAGTDADHAVLSSGTWSLMGLELQHPNCSRAALDAGFSNEIGYGRSVRFLKNICGLWLIEESRRQWQRQGSDVSHAEIADLARQADPLVSLFDPDDPVFAAPGDMPGRIADYCARTGQKIPTSMGDTARCIFDSLAMKYRLVFDRLGQFSPHPLRGLHVLGGGSRNQLLNQTTADALGVPVIAGPAEATAIGNVAAQMIADGQFQDLAQARVMIAASVESETFNPGPQATSQYAQAADRFKSLVNVGASPDRK